MYYTLYDVLTVNLLNFTVPIAFRQKENMFSLLNSLVQIVLLVETLKRRWKNVLDGFTRCLKKMKDNQWSGSANIKIPTCRFFKELEFLKSKVENKQTTSHVNIVNNSGSGSDDISSPPSTAVSSTSSTPDTSLRHSSNKRKLTRPNQIDSSGNVSKRQDTRDQIYLLLLNGLSKENQASLKNQD